MEHRPFEPAPILSGPLSIEDSWIDYNGHLNMAYYLVMFDKASDTVHEMLGMGPAYAASRKLTTYTAETHICYLREVHQHVPVRISYQLLGSDEKRLWTFQQMLFEDNTVAATCEALTLHVDMEGPKVTPFPADVADRLAALSKAHSVLDMPVRAGRSISLKPKANPA